MHRQRWRISADRSGVVVALGLMTLGLWGPGQAAEFLCGAGDVACLIAAINDANANGEENRITLEAGTYTLTAVDNTTEGPNGLPSITSPLTLSGAGAEATIIARAASAPQFRLVHVAAAGHLALEGLTLQGGQVVIPSSGGGGLVNAGGTVTLTQSTLAGNSANSGGGLYNAGGTVTLTQSTLAGNSAVSFLAPGVGGGLYNAGGTVTLTQSTIAGNSVRGSGGGLYNSAGTVTLTQSTLAGNSTTGLVPGSGGGLYNSAGTVTLTQSTLAGNSANSGGGLANGAGTVTLQNTILARNTATTTGSDCAGPVTSLGHNLVGSPINCMIDLLASDLTGDPGLGAFTDDGTPGQGYVPLLPTSRAIDASNPVACPATDQLGQLRVTPCDIGAIEFSPVTLTLGLNQALYRAGETLRVRLGVHNPGPTVIADAYLGVLLPDGVTVLFITSLAPFNDVVTRLDADPRTFAPLAAAFAFPPGFNVTLEDFFVYTFTGGELPGPYTLFTLLTPPGAFEDGQVDAGDLLGLTRQLFTVRP